MAVLVDVINTMKNLNVDNLLQIEELVYLSKQVNDLIQEFLMRDIEVPEYLKQAKSTLDTEIDIRKQALEQAKLRQLEAAVQNTKSQTQRHQDALDKLAAQQRKMGLIPQKTRKRA